VSASPALRSHPAQGAWYRKSRLRPSVAASIALLGSFGVFGRFLYFFIRDGRAGHIQSLILGAVLLSALPEVLRWVIGLSFLAMALWMLVPDKLDDDTGAGKQRFGVFGTTVVAFFLAEMGDKTQIATVALAARYTEVVQVVLGTTVGMMLANVPAVFLGDKIAKKVSMRVVHGVAAAIFAVLGVLTLLNVGAVFG
jgi:putative Ca2+/H+ antiporter (TMEM165/GDT1 family)